MNTGLKVLLGIVGAGLAYALLVPASADAASSSPTPSPIPPSPGPSAPIKVGTTVTMPYDPNVIRKVPGFGTDLDSLAHPGQLLTIAITGQVVGQYFTGSVRSIDGQPIVESRDVQHPQVRIPQ